MSKQLHFMQIPQAAAPQKKEPKKRSFLGKTAEALVHMDLCAREIHTMHAPELVAYDMAAVVRSSSGLSLTPKIQVKSQEVLSGPFSFHKGNGKPYMPGDFDIAACCLLSTKSVIYSFGIPDKALRYRAEDFNNPDYCFASWDVAVQRYFENLAAVFGGNTKEGIYHVKTY